jgi:hypothetical protein
MAICRSPPCQSQIVEETTSTGRCPCGLCYWRTGLGPWKEIVGLVDVTVPGWDGGTRVVRSDGVQFREAFVYLDPVVDKHLNSVFKRRHIESIVPVKE